MNFRSLENFAEKFLGHKGIGLEFKFLEREGAALEKWHVLIVLEDIGGLDEISYSYLSGVWSETLEMEWSIGMRDNRCPLAL